MRLSRRTFLVGTAATLAAVPAARSQSLTAVRLTLPWIPHGGFTHHFVAKKLGLWDKRGLDVKIDRGFGSGEVCKTLGLGQYEFGEMDFGVMTNCVGKGLDLVGLGLIQPKATMGIFALAKKGIRRPADLEGRKVGFATGSGDFQLWPAFVKLTGIDDGKVQKVLMGPEALIKSLIEEQIDAEGNFYGSLAPYGAWVDVPGVGLCWRPTVAVADPYWRPYCDRGHWLFTDAGWYWYSDYSWGWAPFHYGRGCSYPRLGWFWVPDTRWGPAWVSWRYTSSHCGWAPLPPAAVFAGGGFHHGGFSVGVGVDFGLSAGLYTFVGFGHFTDRSFYNHRVSGGQATIIYNHSTVINNYTVNNSGTINWSGGNNISMVLGRA